MFVFYRRLLEEEEKRAGLPASPKDKNGRTPVSGVKRRAEGPAVVPASSKPIKKVRAADVRIALDLIEERVDVTNSTDKTWNLTGWKLKSLEGSQEFTFPDGFELAAGASVVVWSGPVRSVDCGVWRTAYVCVV